MVFINTYNYKVHEILVQRDFFLIRFLHFVHTVPIFEGGCHQKSSKNTKHAIPLTRLSIN